MRLKSISSSLLSYYLFLDNVPFFPFSFLFHHFRAMWNDAIFIAQSHRYLFIFLFYPTLETTATRTFSPPLFFVCVCSPSLSVIHFLKWMSFVTSFFDFPEREKKTQLPTSFSRPKLFFFSSTFKRKKKNGIWTAMSSSFFLFLLIVSLRWRYKRRLLRSGFDR